MSLFNDASFILIPSGIKTGKVYSEKPVNGNGDLTWSRNSLASRTTSSGLIESVGANVPRRDYSQGGCPAFLLEPQRTNLLLYSEEFDNAYWTKVNTTISGNVTSTLDPKGENTAELITTTSGISQSELSRTVTTVIGTSYVFTCFGKKGSGATDLNSFRVAGTGVLNTVTINWDTGVISQTGSGATSRSVGNGWYQIIIPFTANSISTILQLVTFQVYPLGISSLRWGAQLEVGSYPTTYIPTTTATATRIADVFTRNNIYTNGLISASGGTWYVELKNNVSYTRDLSSRIGIGDFANLSVNNLSLNSLTNGRITVQKFIAGVPTVLFTTTTDTCKIAIKWNGSTADVFENGVKVVSATEFTTTNMEFLSRQSLGIPLFIQAMALFPEPMSDVDCEVMTGTSYDSYSAMATALGYTVI